MNYELNHIVMREHLGFEGLIMTDWWLRTDYGGARGRPAAHQSRAYSPEFDLGPGQIVIDEIRGNATDGWEAVISAPAVNPDTTANLDAPRRTGITGILDLPRDGRWSGAASGTGTPLAPAAFTLAPHGTGLNNHDMNDGFRFAYNSYRLRGRLDLLMPGNQWRGRGTAWAYNGDGAGSPNGVNWSMSNPMHMYRLGFMNIGEIQAAGRNVLNVAMQSARFRIDNELPMRDFGPMTPIFEVTQNRVEPPMLDGINLTLGGETVSLIRFVPNVTNYTIFARDMANLPVVTGVAREGLDVVVTPAAAVEGPYVTTSITVTDPATGLSRIYRVHFTGQAGMVPEFEGATLARLASVSVNGVARPDFHPMRWVAPWAMQVAALDDVELTATAAVGSEIESITRAANQYRISVASDSQRVVYVINLQTGQAANQPVLANIPVTTIAGEGTSRIIASLGRNWANPVAANIVGNNADPYSDHGGATGGTAATLPNQHLGMTPVGRFATYNIYVEEAGYYRVRARFASNFGAVATHLLIPLFIGFDEMNPATQLTYGATGGLGTTVATTYQWQTTGDEIVFLEAGNTWLRVLSRDGNFNINWIEFEAYVEVTCKNELRVVLDEALDLNQENFSGPNWRLFNPALNHALAVYENLNSTQEEIDHATNTLRNLVNRQT
jgi:hypothetical protein